MKIISLPRGMGKTTKLMKISAESGASIVCRNLQTAKAIAEEAERLKLKIPFPATYHSVLKGGALSLDTREVLVDDVDYFLEFIIGRPVKCATYTPK